MQWRDVTSRPGYDLSFHANAVITRYNIDEPKHWRPSWSSTLNFPATIEYIVAAFQTKNSTSNYVDTLVVLAKATSKVLHASAKFIGSSFVAALMTSSFVKKRSDKGKLNDELTNVQDVQNVDIRQGSQCYHR